MSQERSGGGGHGGLLSNGGLLTKASEIPAFMEEVRTRLMLGGVQKMGINLVIFLDAAEEDGGPFDDHALEEAYNKQMHLATRYAKHKLNATPAELRDPIYLEEIREIVDAGAQQELLWKCPIDIRTFLIRHNTAAAKCKHLPSFFGAKSVTRRTNHKKLIKYVKYQPGQDGAGFRELFKTMEELRAEMVLAGATVPDEDLLIDIIEKCRSPKGREDLFRSDRFHLTERLEQGALTLHEARATMMEAERREEGEAADSSDDEVEAKSAHITSSSSSRDTAIADLQRDLARSNLDNARLQQQMLALVTRDGSGGGSGGGGRGARGGGGARAAREKKLPCFNFRDTGACKFGDKCRFLHQ